MNSEEANITIETLKIAMDKSSHQGSKNAIKMAIAWAEKMAEIENQLDKTEG